MPKPCGKAYGVYKTPVTSFYLLYIIYGLNVKSELFLAEVKEMPEAKKIDVTVKCDQIPKHAKNTKPH